MYNIHAGTDLSTGLRSVSKSQGGAKRSARAMSRKEPNIKLVVVSPDAEIIAVYLDGEPQPIPED